MADSYLEKAQALKNKNPNLTPQDIIKEIGQPPKGKRLESKGKGKVGYKSWDARRAARKSYNKERTVNRQVSTGSLTKEERAYKRSLEEEAAQRRAAGEDVEILHEQRVGLTGPQLRRLPKSEQIAARRKLKEAYGGALGDKSENISIGSGAENRQEEVDWQNVQRKLGEMEQDQPSLPNHPNLSKTLSAEEVRDLVGFNESLYTGAKLGMQIVNGGIRLTRAVIGVGAAMAGMK